MFKLKASSLTPAPVFNSIGYVDDFHDLLVHDFETGDCICADHLLTDLIKEFLDCEDLLLEEHDEMIDLI